MLFCRPGSVFEPGNVHPSFMGEVPLLPRVLPYKIKPDTTLFFSTKDPIAIVPNHLTKFPHTNLHTPIHDPNRLLA